MIKTAKLIGLIAEKGLNQRAVARKLGINEATFYRKMRRGVFEIYGMIELLGIENPETIFFAKDGTLCVPNDREQSAESKHYRNHTELQ